MKGYYTNKENFREQKKESQKTNFEPMHII